MLIRWSRHSKQRFAERAAKLGINYGEIELAVKKQKVKLKEGKKKIQNNFQNRRNIIDSSKN
ncbi:hypothetical protein KJ972_02995 [Candidatus Micrarchaeota archaeon]|nr:hypothetical protein [Candidatus Micrarchaeota archaeon]